MHSLQIEMLLNFLAEKYGGFEYYGSSPSEKHGVCFKLQGILATFSAHTQDGRLRETYDVQVEGVPPGEYIHTCEVSLPELIQLIAKFEQPEEKWP